MFFNMPTQSGTPSPSADKTWAYAGTIIVAGFVLFLYREVFQGLVSDWYHDPDYSHGFLVPFLSGYFIWERGDALRKEKISPSLLGAGVLCVGLFLIIGLVGAELYVQRFSFLIVLAGLVLLILGWRFLWILSFPIGFLIGVGGEFPAACGVTWASEQICT